MGENTTRIPVTMPSAMAEALRRESERRDLSISQIVREALRESKLLNGGERK